MTDIIENFSSTIMSYSKILVVVDTMGIYTFIIYVFQK